MKKVIVRVKGMTCSSCEVILERKLSKLAEVDSVTVSRSKEQAVIHCNDSVTLKQLQEAVFAKGYTLQEISHSQDTKRSSFTFLDASTKRLNEIAAISVLMLGAYLFLKTMNLLPETLGVTDSMSYGFIVVLGLVAASSTCLAVSGGLLLALSTKYNESHPDLSKKEKFKPHIYFNLGRIFSYTFFGGLIGLVGSALTISPFITGVLTLIASAFMLVIGLQLLGIFPWVNKISLKMPKWIAHRIYDSSSGDSLQVTPFSSALFGASTFFLPCGFTQALQLYVLSLGDFSTGALSMLAFSLGTLPALLGIGLLSSYTKGDFHKYFTTFSALLVIVLSVLSVPSAMTLTGISFGSFGSHSGSLEPTAPLVNGVQIVDMTVDYLDYVPQEFVIRQNVPVEWRIDARTAVGCAQIISVPSLGIVERLSQSEITTIHFTPNSKGTISFSCTMGMAGPGTFRVV